MSYYLLTTILCDGFVSIIELYVVLSTLLCLLAVLFLATARDCCGTVDDVLDAMLVAVAAFSVCCAFCDTSSSTLDVYST